jgi:hypothetical protein
MHVCILTHIHAHREDQISGMEQNLKQEKTALVDSMKAEIEHVTRKLKQNEAKQVCELCVCMYVCMYIRACLKAQIEHVTRKLKQNEVEQVCELCEGLKTACTHACIEAERHMHEYTKRAQCMCYICVPYTYIHTCIHTYMYTYIQSDGRPEAAREAVAQAHQEGAEG